MGPCAYLRTLRFTSTVQAAATREGRFSEPQGPDPAEQAHRPRQIHFPGATRASAPVGRRLPLTHYNSQRAPREKRQRARGLGPRQLHFPGATGASAPVGRRLPHLLQLLERPARTTPETASDHTSHDSPGARRAGKEGTPSDTTTPRYPTAHPQAHRLSRQAPATITRTDCGPSSSVKDLQLPVIVVTRIGRGGLRLQRPSVGWPRQPRTPSQPS